MDTLEPQIEQTMEAYNMPELPANIQWDIERRWVTYLQACKEDGQMTYSPLTLADLTTMVTSNPTALNPPLKVKTLIAKAIAVPSLGGPPPQPPPRPSPPPSYRTPSGPSSPRDTKSRGEGPCSAQKRPSHTIRTNSKENMKVIQGRLYHHVLR